MQSVLTFVNIILYMFKGKEIYSLVYGMMFSYKEFYHEYELLGPTVCPVFFRRWCILFFLKK